jgi:hypothetical protein
MPLETQFGKWIAGASIAIFVGAVGPSRAGFNEQEIECEEAVAHVSECCSELAGHQFACTYSDDGCFIDTAPDFDVDDSRCIRSRSCNTLRAQGVCDRIVQGLASTRSSSSSDWGGASPLFQGVCQ